MKRCARCILPETFPGIHFNADGVCNFCSSYRGDAAHAQAREKYENKFLQLLEQKRRQSTHDIIMAYSGGKDSTYTLDIFVNRYEMRALALTFDNTFISEGAVRNIHRVCDVLNVDHLMVRPAGGMLRNIFAEGARREIFSAKTLERASTICTSCIGFVKSVVLRTALERNIPFVGFGWSPGQAPVQASVMKTNPALMRTTQKAVYDPLYAIAGDAINPYFLFDEHFSMTDRFPYNIHPLAFLNYDEEKIIARNREIGWEKPNDTDANSTNCLLNAFANQVHKSRYGFHPYVWELANMVRDGSMERDFAIDKIESPENADIVNYARGCLGVGSNGR